MTIVKVKDKLGIIMIESHRVRHYVNINTNEEHEVWSLNNVLMEDGTTKMVGDEDMEVVDSDWSEEIDS